MKTTAKIEFGDFQTPVALAREVCLLLKQHNVEASTIIEPTCGTGAFLIAAAEAFPESRLLGWDINPDYVIQAETELQQMRLSKRSSVGRMDFFAHDWEREIAAIQGSILILGNLPWVTNATVSGLSGTNLPAKENFQGFRGIEARMGKSNFDISEWMLIRLVQALRGRAGGIAMLSKTGTARKLLRYAWQNDGRISSASLYRIDAKKSFGASVDACLLLARTGKNGAAEADVFGSLAAKRPSMTIGMAGQDWVSDVPTYRRLKHFEGLCPYQWRSGVKHDCASVMELRRGDDGGFENKLGEHINIEPNYLYPLLKCSDLANGRIKPDKSVIVTQRKVGEDTSIIASTAPHTWRYLDSHRYLFEARKSSIYNKGVPFSIFGIGDYAFAPWKVAVSGLHRATRFCVVGPIGGRPVVFDDTCNFVPFASEAEASIVAEVLNSQECQRFLQALSFADAKRPMTVELLGRLNIHALAEACGLAEAWTESRQRSLQGTPTNVPIQAEMVMERPAL